MTTTTKISLLAAAGALLVATACSELDPGLGGSASSGANALVFGTDAPGDVTILEVELVDVRVYADAHDTEGALLVPAGGGSVVDLVAAAASGSPGLFNEFGIPEGTWACADGTFSLATVQIRDQNDEDVLCSSIANVPGSITIPRLCLRNAIVVGESGTTDMVFDLPVLRGEVVDDAGTCEFEFDRSGMRLMRLADF